MNLARMMWTGGKNFQLFAEQISGRLRYLMKERSGATVSIIQNHLGLIYEFHMVCHNLCLSAGLRCRWNSVQRRRRPLQMKWTAGAGKAKRKTIAALSSLRISSRTLVAMWRVHIIICLLLLASASPFGPRDSSASHAKSRSQTQTDERERDKCK